jgi:transposase-like protein
LSLQIGQNESSEYWLGILNELKNRGVKDILILCADGLTGMKESISVAFPETEYQRCIVHQARNTLKYVSYKDRKKFCCRFKDDLPGTFRNNYLRKADRSDRTLGTSVSECHEKLACKLGCHYAIFKFSADVRKVIYTTNAIESLNSTYRRLNRNRSVFPSTQALLKALYLATFEATKKWTMPLKNWGKVYGELSIMYEGRW